MNIKNLKAKRVFFVNAIGESSVVNNRMVMGRPLYHFYKNLPDFMRVKTSGLFVPYFSNWLIHLA